MSTRFVLQGHDRHGWDTRDVSSMEDVRAYLQHAHFGEITFYADDVAHIVPEGLGDRTLTASDVM